MVFVSLLRLSFVAGFVEGLSFFCDDFAFVPQTYLIRCETLCFILVDAALLSSGLSRLLL